MRTPDLRDIIIGELSHCPDAYVISVDSAVSSKLEGFRALYPERYVELGVAEQNAVSVACGMASEGVHPFLFGISAFLLFRAYEQIRTILGIGNYRVNLCGLWAGLFYSDQGPTHRQTEDVALLRTVPNMRIFSPTSIENCRQLVRRILLMTGPTYLRIENPTETGNYLPTVGDDLASVNEVCTGHEVALVATGQMVSTCLKAAEIAVKKNVKLGIVAIADIHPIPLKLLLPILHKYEVVIVVEEHYSDCGMGTTILRALYDTRARQRVYLHGVEHPHTGTLKYLSALEHYGLDASSLAQFATKLVIGQAEVFNKVSD